MSHYTGNWIYQGHKVRVQGVQHSNFFLEKGNPFFVADCDGGTGSQFFVWFGDQDTDKSSWMNTAPSLVDRKSLEILASQSKKVLQKEAPLEAAFGVATIKWDYAQTLDDVRKELFTGLVGLEKQIFYYALREGAVSYVRQVAEACDFLKSANEQTLLQSDLQAKNNALQELLGKGRDGGSKGPWGKPIEGNNKGLARTIMTGVLQLAKEATKSSLRDHGNLIKTYLKDTADHLEVAALALKDDPAASKKAQYLDTASRDYFTEMAWKDLVQMDNEARPPKFR